MLSNVTIDDYSPLIQYKGEWVDAFNSPYDPYVSRYSNRSFHCSRTNGSTAFFSFRGTAVYIFGAKRGNHGYYRVSLDGEPSQQFDGYAGTQPDKTDGVYQVPIFSRIGLSNNVHNVTLTNFVNGDRPYVDIDFITWTRESNSSSNKQLIDDSEFDYSGFTSRWTFSSPLDGYHQSTAHSTDVFGASSVLNFSGNEIFLYGGTGPTHGAFKVQLDDQPARTLNGSAVADHPQTLLYTSSGLGTGAHKLVITNTEAGAVLDIDYAEVVPHQASSIRRGMRQATIAGIAVGVVALSILLGLLLWRFFGKGRHARGPSVDLLGASYEEMTPMKIYPYADNLSTGGPDTYSHPQQAAEASNSSIYTETTAGTLPPSYEQTFVSGQANTASRRV